MLVIGFIGGAGVGKSTLAAETFVTLKKQQFNVEQLTEYAKDKTWEESFRVLNNQIYVFAKQHHRLWRLNKKVVAVITDSPMILSSIYLQGENKPLNDLIIHEWKKYNNLLFYIKRSTEYSSIGRNQTIEESIAIDNKIIKLLHNNDIEYETINDLENAQNQIMSSVVKRLR